MGEEEKETEKLEHVAIVLVVKHQLKDAIQGVARDYGKELKEKEIETKEFRLLILDVAGEALESLQKEARAEKDEKK